jgi:hypothetical protein
MKRLTHLALVALAALVAPVAPVAPVALVSPAAADVTLKTTTAGKGMGMSGTIPGTIYIKGNKMRTDSVTGDTTRSVIFDLDTQKMISFDSKKKEADVYDMQKLSAEISQNVQAGDMKATVKANGKTKSIAGHTAAGYDAEITVPATMGGRDGMKMTVYLTGPMWIVKGVPGASEYINFYKNAVEKGWFFTDPRAAKGQPGQAKAMAEMYRQLAATGGIPFEQEMNIKMGGEGPMAGLMAKMGNITMTTSIQSVNADPVPADMFAPPAGYKLKEQK